MNKWIYSLMTVVLPCSAVAELYIEAGPWYRGDMRIEVQGGSIAADEGMQAASPGTRGGVASVVPLTAGDNGAAQILRTFDNGYVGPSGWAWAIEEGISQYFGYESADQYDSSAGSLSFTRSTSGADVQRRTITTVSSGPAGWSGSEQVDGVGAQATLGYRVRAEDRYDLSVQGQFGWLGGIDASFRDQQAWRQDVTWTTRETTASRSQVWRYDYDTLGNPVFPSAPYQMTDPAGVGPMIGDTPTRITGEGEVASQTDRAVGRRTASAFSRVDLDAEMELFSFMLGPRLRWLAADRVALVFQGGLTLNLIDADLRRTERFAWGDGAEIARWSVREDDQKWRWGGRLSAGAQVDLTDRVYVSALAGYDWVESAAFNVGPDRVDADLSGYHVEVAVGFAF